MKTRDWLLVLLLAVLTVSTLSTGALAVYLTLNRQQAGSPSLVAVPTERRGEQGALAIQAPVAAGAEAATESRITFVSNRDGDTAIYTIDPDGSRPQKVSAPGPGSCILPSWSPDCRRVAYVRAEELSDDEHVARDVWVSEADGSEHIHVTPNVSTTAFLQPAWSPDGERLAFVAADTTSEGSDPTPYLHVARADGSGIERSVPISWTAIHQIEWSPIGDEFLFVTGDPSADQASVHVMSLDGSESIAQMAMQPADIAWSPSGTHLAVVTTRSHRQGYATNLDVVTLATGDIAVASEGQGWVDWPSWSPDGGRVLFTLGSLTRTPGLPPADLWAYDLASNQSKPLTLENGFDGNGVWSP